MKYMGSKNRIIKDILPIILKNRVDNQFYVEPFVGGFNSMCEVDGNRIASDNNKYLISMWKKLLDGWIPNYIEKDKYYEIKNNKENFPNYLVGWVGFNCSYSGKWFGGYAGKIITKDGLLRDYQKEALNNIEKQLKKIDSQKLIIVNDDYNKLIIPNNSIIYCDPPYKNTTKYHSNFNHDEFYKWCYNKALQGHIIYISEYEMPSPFRCVWEKEVKSSLSANGKSGSSKVSIEKLFTLI